MSHNEKTPHGPTETGSVLITSSSTHLDKPTFLLWAHQNRRETAFTNDRISEAEVTANEAKQLSKSIADDFAQVKVLGKKVETLHGNVGVLGQENDELSARLDQLTEKYEQSLTSIKHDVAKEWAEIRERRSVDDARMNGVEQRITNVEKQCNAMSGTIRELRDLLESLPTSSTRPNPQPTLQKLDTALSKKTLTSAGRTSLKSDHSTNIHLDSAVNQQKKRKYTKPRAPSPSTTESDEEEISNTLANDRKDAGKLASKKGEDDVTTRKLPSHISSISKLRTTTGGATKRNATIEHNARKKKKPNNALETQAQRPPDKIATFSFKTDQLRLRPQPIPEGQTSALIERPRVRSNPRSRAEPRKTPASKQRTTRALNQNHHEASITRDQEDGERFVPSPQATSGITERPNAVFTFKTAPLRLSTSAPSRKFTGSKRFKQPPQNTKSDVNHHGAAKAPTGSNTKFSQTQTQTHALLARNTPLPAVQPPSLTKPTERPLRRSCRVEEKKRRDAAAAAAAAAAASAAGKVAGTKRGRSRPREEGLFVSDDEVEGEGKGGDGDFEMVGPAARLKRRKTSEAC